MKCKRCSSERILFVQAHCRDLCFMRIGEKEHDGYVLGGFGIGAGDDVEIDICLDCGQVQGKFPVPKHDKLE